MVIDLLNKRFHNYCAMHPDRGEADELHNVDFMDILKRGESILDIAPLGAGGKVKGIDVDLSPVDDHEVIAKISPVPGSMTTAQAFLASNCSTTPASTRSVWYWISASMVS